MSVLFPYDSGFCLTCTCSCKQAASRPLFWMCFGARSPRSPTRGGGVVPGDSIRWSCFGIHRKSSTSRCQKWCQKSYKNAEGKGGGWLGLRMKKKEEKKTLGGGFKYFLFSPRKLGKISNLTNIFQVG